MSDKEYVPQRSQLEDVNFDLYCAYQRISELEQQLAAYQSGVEVEGIVIRKGSWDSPMGLLAMDDELKDMKIGQRVRVLVMKEVECINDQYNCEQDLEVEPNEECEAYKQGYRDGIHPNCRNPYPSNTADSWQWVYGYDQYISERYVVD